MPYISNTQNVNLLSRLDAINDSINIGQLGGVDPTTRQIVIASAMRTATVQSVTLDRGGMRGAVLYLYVTAVSGNAGENINLKIRAISPLTGNPISVYVPASILGNSAVPTEYIYMIYPGLTGSSGYTASNAFALPSQFRVEVTHSGSGSFTYSVGMDWVP
jgi:hypothetical protein